MDKATIIFWVVVVVALVGAAACFKLVLRLFGIVLVPDDRVAIVTKKWTMLTRARLPDGKIVALAGEAGIQADTLAPGVYFCYWPWQYSIEAVKFITIESGEIGLVESIDGVPIPMGRVLAKNVDSDSYQSARKFLEAGGQRGLQITVMPPGQYRINTALFRVDVKPALQIPQGQVGIVTTREGASLPTGEIAGKEIPDHDLFQNGQAFLDHGGYKGLQEQVVLAGTYYLNPVFVSVEFVEMTAVPIGSVGVVVAYVGKISVAAQDTNFKQGTIVETGCKGVWAVPLDPGKYPINPYTHGVVQVPTTNIVLNWAAAKTEAHQLDKNLSTITVRSSDGFTFNLDVSQIIHISRQSASKVIARFGNMTNLVTQVLEPLIGNYFRNSAQTSDVIAFLRERSVRQQDAKEHISAALGTYDVQAVDTLIGDITPPMELMKTLTDRKVAEQQNLTYGQQETAQVARAKLQEQTALADTKGQVVQAGRSVEIAEMTANAKIKTAEGDAKSKTVNADADAAVLAKLATGHAEAQVTEAQGQATATIAVADADAHATEVKGKAEGTKELAVGMAQATVLKNKVDAVGKEAYAMMQIADFLAQHNMKLVPDIVIGAGGTGGTIMDGFLAQLVMATRPGAHE